jgi:uncharacterized protein (TIGR02646 family)
MIHVNRSKAPVPQILRSRAAEAARKEAADFFGRPRSKRTQERHAFHEELWRKALKDLQRLFRGKCAYCEKRPSESDGIVVSHFRPTGHAKQLGGSSSPDHYWWLAYEYDNLYPSCGDCLKQKAAMFPVSGKRVVEGAVGKQLNNESALLLDPCLDNPQEYLHFLPSGRVIPGGGKRGQRARAARASATIDTLGLNRKDLVHGRALAMENVATACRALSRRRRRLVAGTGAAMSHPAARVRKLLASWLPFGAARRQAARDALRSMGAFGEQVAVLVPELDAYRVGESAAQVRAPSVRRRRTAYVRELTICNFRMIRRLELAFEDPPLRESGDPIRTGWTVYVGENGAGKTSILQALALALGGEYQLRKAVVNWDKLLRRPRGRRKRPREGFVKVGLSTGDAIELRFNKDRAWFKSGGEGALTTLRAYGATRNLPTTRPPASWKSVEAMVRIVNLFDPYSPLCSAEGWIAGLTKDRFEVVALALKDLMRLEPGDRIRRQVHTESDSGRRIHVPIVDIGNSTSRFDDLSDGYQSMVALAVDIMAGLSKKTSDFRTDPGIVMIDELGNHLHPSWRMQVVASLRRTFPRMQFVVTTHDPLCLRGLEIGEIVVLRRESRGTTAQIVNESVAHLRADQLLTSPLFGLVGTRDPDVLRASEGDTQRYDELFLKATRSPAEESELQHLRAAIVQRTAAGETPTERFVEQAVRQALTELTKVVPAPSELDGPPAPEAIRAALRAKFTELLK